MTEINHHSKPPAAQKYRRKSAFLPILSAAFALLSALPASADSVAVAYTAAQVSSTTWQYNYTLSGSISAGDLLAIYFPSATSSTITDLSTGTTALTTSILQADTALPADGEYDIVATSATSTFSGTFDVTLVYSGTGTPGAQSFTLYDSSFATIASGTTTSATTTPEPGSLLLIGTGVLILLACRRKEKSVAALAGLALLTLPLAVDAQGPPGGGPPGGGPPGGGPGGPTTTAISGMTIGSYKLLSSYRASTYQYYYTYTTSVTNNNAAPYSYVLGTLTSASANTVVVSGSVEFGLVPAGGSASGLTGFTILQDRRYAFDPSTLSWAYTGATSTAVGTTPTAVSLNSSSSSVAYGTTLNLTAAVSPATSTGTVAFYDGPLPVGTATITSGAALLSNVALPVGSHNLSAAYGGDSTYAASSSTQDAVAVGTGGAVASCSGLQEIAIVVCLTNAFEATLTSTQLATAQLSYTLANAEVWSNLPNPARNGLEFSSLTSTQLAAAMQLAQAAMSAQGYTRLQNLIGANGILGQYTTGYGAGLYYIAVLGTPSTTSAWQLQIGGHHVAFNHTFNGSYASGTPYFIGNEPALFNIAGTLYVPMRGPHDAAYALTRSVYGNSTALLSGTFDDVLTGSSGVDAYPHTYPTSGRGILYTSLTSAQQAQVKAMIEAWVNDMDSSTASSLLSTYEDATALANTYVGYSGTGTLTTQGDYIRIDGPRVWIEFCVQNGIVFSQSYHYHTIWRDKTADYGGDFAGE